MKNEFLRSSTAVRASVAFAIAAHVLSGSFVQREAQALPAGAYGLLGIVPGLGQVAQGEWLEGAAYFGTVTGGYAGGYALHGKRKFEASGYSLQLSLDAWMYSAYDAYNDKGNISKNSLGKNLLSAFDLRLLASPAVSLPLAFFATVAALVPDQSSHRVFDRPFRNKATAHAVAFGTGWVGASLVGVGEEALFRGFLQHSLSTNLTPWVGLPLASALFGMAHTQYGAAGKIQVGIFGLYLGILAHRDKYDLRRAIILHTLYDALIFLRQWREGEPVPFQLRLPTVSF